MRTASRNRLDEQCAGGRTPDGASRWAGERRGAVIAFVGVMITVLMMLAAIAVDASRLLAAKNELQTSADAAALAVAIRLLDTTGGGVSVTDSLRAFVGLNRVQNEEIDSVRIEYGVWRAATRVFVEQGDPKDAVRITLKHPVKLTFGRLLGDSVIEVGASAIAWANAPVEETKCAKPLAVPYGRLLQVLGDANWQDPNFHRDLTDEDILRLREMNKDARSKSFYYAIHPAEDSIATPDEKAYYPLDMDTIWRDQTDADMNRDSDTVGTRYYKPYLGSESCSKVVRPGDVVRTEPEGKRAATREGLNDLCAARYGGALGPEGHCRVNGDETPMPIKVVFWSDSADWVGANRASVKVRAVGSYVIKRIARTDETQGKERDKIYGWFDVQRDWGRLGSTPTTLFRPVLVR